MRRTVLILGAGASCPYGFPTAGELREIIVQHNKEKVHAAATRMRIERNLWPEVRKFALARHGDAELTRFQKEFLLSQFPSADAFVQSRGQNFDVIARHLIAAVLLPCEHSSDLDNDWYQSLRNNLLQAGPAFAKGSGIGGQCANLDCL